MNFDDVENQDDQQVIKALNTDLLREQNGEDLSSEIEKWHTTLSILTASGRKYVKAFLNDKLGTICTYHNEQDRRPFYMGMYDYVQDESFCPNDES